MTSYANANSTKPRKAYSWLIVETVTVAIIVGVSKVPSPWAALLILTPIVFFAGCVHTLDGTVCYGRNLQAIY
jgi:hypothetical protein